MAACTFGKKMVTRLVNKLNSFRSKTTCIQIHSSADRVSKNGVLMCMHSRSTQEHPSSVSGTRLSCLRNSLPAMNGHQATPFHTSVAAGGLEEFFDEPKNWGEPVVKAGRAWSKDELRLKDVVMLHKLWYVLLKEKNMLLTMQAEADRQGKFLASPERISKVQVSMDHLQEVLKERQEALTELQTGRREEHPGEWQYTPFGYKRYVKPREYPIPKYMNRYWSSKRKWYDPFVSRYMTQWYEQEVRRGAREKRRRRSQLLKLRKRFPGADIWQDQ